MHNLHALTLIFLTHMNEERAIIVHTAFVQQCVKVGRTVVDELRTAILNDEEITDEKLEKLFTPLIEFVEKETDTRVGRETDEIRAKVAEELELQAKEKKLSQIRTYIENYTSVNVNGKRQSGFHTEKSVKRLKKAISDPKTQELIPEFKTVTMATGQPMKDPIDLAKDPSIYVEGVEWYDNIWKDYCPQVYFTVDPPADEILDGSFSGLLGYAKKKGINFLTIESLVLCASKLCSNWHIEQKKHESREVAILCDNALKRPLTPDELCRLLPNSCGLGDFGHLYEIRQLIASLHNTKGF